MRLTMELKPTSRRAPTTSKSRPTAGPAAQGGALLSKPVAIEAMVIDERREPVEMVPGVMPLRSMADAGELALTTDLPLLPGSHVLVQVGDRHALDAASKRFEVEVLRCRKWLSGHEVAARLVRGELPSEWRRAA